MSNNTKIDWTVFTDPEVALDLYGHSVRKSLSYDSYAGKTIFKARALTDMFPLTANQLMAIDGGATGTESGTNKRSAFKARIIGANSPHSFLPDVCDPAYSSDESTTYKLISMHTTFISTDLTLGVGVSRGDIVTVELNKSGQSYELEYGRFLELSAQENPGESAKTECFALKDLIGGWAPPMGGDSFYGPGGGIPSAGKYYECKGDIKKCGPKDDLTFSKCKTPTFDSLAKKKTSFKNYKKPEVIAAIKASGQPEYIQKIMFVFLKKEQPEFSFPNNNVAGIQLDGDQFDGTVESDFDYQTCFRDSGGDQRIFAGFETLDKGMKVFGKAVAGKMKVFKKPTGASKTADAEILTWNYYRQWNLGLDPAELAELKANGQVFKKGKTYKKNWNQVKASFEKSLTEWENV